MDRPVRRRNIQNYALLAGEGRYDTVDEFAVVADSVEENVPRRRGRPRKIPVKSGQSSPPPRKNSLPNTFKCERPLTPDAEAKTKATNKQENFIVKLFGRRINLTNCTEQTPLYPVCRAWVKNQPSNATIRNYQDRHTPSPVKREDNGEELLQMLRRGEIHEVNAMPAPRGPILSKIPAIKKTATEIQEAKAAIDALVLNMEAGVQSNASKEELLAQHMVKWKKTKADSLKRMKESQKRYELSGLILKELFKPRS